MERQQRLCVAIEVLGVMLLVASGCGGGQDPAAASEETPTRADADEVLGVTTGTASTPTPPAEEDYTVQAGDTLYDLALAWGTTVEAIVALNGITDADVLDIGQVLKKPPPGEE